MSDTMIECVEVAGKTVHRLRVASSNTGGQEVHLEFTDGTAFTFTVEPSTIRKAALVAQCEGAIKTIQSYDE